MKQAVHCLILVKSTYFDSVQLNERPFCGCILDQFTPKNMGNSGPGWKIPKFAAVYADKMKEKEKNGGIVIVKFFNLYIFVIPQTLLQQCTWFSPT